jgi:hypothetical protein
VNPAAARGTGSGRSQITSHVRAVGESAGQLPFRVRTALKDRYVWLIYPSAFSPTTTRNRRAESPPPHQLRPPMPRLPTPGAGAFSFLGMGGKGARGQASRGECDAV